MLSKMMFKKNRSGFTLVELMAVVLIIGVLVAIAVPVYQNSTADAKVKACKANVRTIMGAAAQYESAESTSPSAVSDLVTEGYLKAVPVCPVPGAPAYEIAEADSCGDHFYQADGSTAATSLANAVSHK